MVTFVAVDTASNDDHAQSVFC